jgi:hypothetical protein
MNDPPTALVGLHTIFCVIDQTASAGIVFTVPDPQRSLALCCLTLALAPAVGQPIRTG